MNKLNVKKDDTVLVITGKDKGALPEKERVIVQNVAMITRHRKPRRQGEPGGRITQEGTIHVSNVMLVCPHCDKATRVAHAYDKNNKKVRACKKCNKNID